MRNHKSLLEKRIYLTVAFVTVCSPVAIAQQLGQYTQYISNELVINPAYAGADEALSLTFVNRSQWSGIEGAPATQTFSGHSLFMKENFGLGIMVSNDKVGIHSNLTALGVYSYRLKIDTDTYLSMGLQLGMNHKKSDFSSITGQTLTPNDPKLINSNVTQASLEFGTGVYFKSPRFRVGLSVPKLFPGKSTYNDSISLRLNRSHYFLLARYLTSIGYNVKLQPGFLIKYLPGLPVSLDLNANLIVKEVLLVGISYRSSDSVNSILQAKITPQLKLGYSFDFPTGKFSRLNNSAHELMVNYIFKFSNHSVSGSR